MKALEQFNEYLKEMNYYDHAALLMYWDMKTATPKEALYKVSDSSAFFNMKKFNMATSEEFGKLLCELNEPEAYGQLDDAMKFIVRQMKEDYDRDKRIPADFYEEYIRAITDSENAWVEAKTTDNYELFAPHLKNMIEYSKKLYSYTDPDMDCYDAMLNQYERGMNSATIDRIFDELKSELIPFIKEILSKSEPSDEKFRIKYSIDEERHAQEYLLKYIGFNFDRGSFAESEHPFTMNFCSRDARVTNHYSEDDIIDPIFTAIHEGGHAVFEQNVNPEYDCTVAGSCRYMGIHESQSRFYENILGRNRNFWVPIYKDMQDIIKPLSNISLDEFYAEINHIRASYIRTAADEVTYCLHIIIRYEIEKAIFRDNVDVDKLPALWNELMEKYLGITPPNDRLGILQDTHWADASFGYFPSYLLGSIYDGMYIEAIEKDLGDIDTILKKGRILDITHWLNEKIHRFGSTRTPLEMLDAVCGKEISAKPLITYFKKKYGDLYK